MAEGGNNNKTRKTEVKFDKKSEITITRAVTLDGKNRNVSLCEGLLGGRSRTARGFLFSFVDLAGVPLGRLKLSIKEVCLVEMGA